MLNPITYEQIKAYVKNNRCSTNCAEATLEINELERMLECDEGILDSELLRCVLLKIIRYLR